MNKIYDFGNALIDIEVILSEEDLTSLNIKKGSMVHINAKQRDIWLKMFENKILSKNPGGSIANTIYSATTQFSNCSFSSSVGPDLE